MKKLAQIDFYSLGRTKDNAGNPVQYSGGTMGDLITRLLPYLFAFAGIGLLFYLISGGFRIMTAAGDPKKIQEGQHAITNALIGFIVIFVAFWLVSLLGQLLGLAPIIEIF